MKDNPNGHGANSIGLFLEFIKEIVLGSGENVNSKMRLSFYGAIVIFILIVSVPALVNFLFGSNNSINDDALNIAITGALILLGLGIVAQTFTEWSKNVDRAARSQNQVEPSTKVQAPMGNAKNLALPASEKTAKQDTLPKIQENQIQNPSTKVIEKESKMRDLKLEDALLECFIEALSTSNFVRGKAERENLCDKVDFEYPEYIDHKNDTTFSERLIRDLIKLKRLSSLMKLCRLVISYAEGKRPDLLPCLEAILLLYESKIN